MIKQNPQKLEMAVDYSWFLDLDLLPYNFLTLLPYNIFKQMVWSRGVQVIISFQRAGSSDYAKFGGGVAKRTSMLFGEKIKIN